MTIAQPILEKRRHLKPDSVWLHENGVQYTVLILTNVNVSSEKRDEYPLSVVYMNPEGDVYSKSVEGFLNKRTLIKPAPL